MHLYYRPVTSGNAAPKKWPMMVNQWMPAFGHLKMFVVGRLGSAHDFFLYCSTGGVHHRCPLTFRALFAETSLIFIDQLFPISCDSGL